jgi:hypothetical protein
VTIHGQLLKNRLTDQGSIALTDQRSKREMAITTSVERLYQWCAIQTATSLLILAPATL